MLSKAFSSSFSFVLAAVVGGCVINAPSDEGSGTTGLGESAESSGGSGSTSAEPGDSSGAGSAESSTGADESSTGAADDPTDDVVGLIIRRVNPGQDVGAFEAAREAYRQALFAQPGSVLDREYRSTVDFSTGMPPAPAVYVGATQFTSLESFSAGAMALGGSDEESEFFATFMPEYFALLAPLDGGPVDITLLGSGGQMLEVAPRDLSLYDDFDPDAYASARDAFIDMLAAREGVVAEFQWVSPADPNVAVGMTVYDSQDAWQAIWSDPEFLGSDEFTAFIGGYPPNGGYLSEIVDTIGQ
ncbi:MAG: hypothetical protein AAGF11_18065 [Myxococcota bacterium]